MRQHPSHTSAPQNPHQHARRWRQPQTEFATNSGPEAVSPELVEAMVPSQILQEDEVVLLLTKPSLFFIFFDSVVFVVVTLMFGAIGSQLAMESSRITPRMVAAVTAIVCICRIVWSLLVWTSYIYMLTNLRIVTIKGVVNVHMFQAQLRKIQTTELYRPILQRLVGTGTIGLATAAAAGSAESTWVMVGRPIETHEQLVAAINKAQSK